MNKLYEYVKQAAMEYGYREEAKRQRHSITGAGKKAEGTINAKAKSKYDEYRIHGYLEDMSDADIDAHIKKYMSTATGLERMEYKAINELMAKYDNNGKDGHTIRFKGKH